MLGALLATVDILLTYLPRIEEYTMIFLSHAARYCSSLLRGITGIGIYYVPHAAAQNLERELALWLHIVFAFSYLLGL